MLRLAKGRRRFRRRFQQMQMMAGDFLNDYVFLTAGRALPVRTHASFQFVEGGISRSFDAVLVQCRSTWVDASLRRDEATRTSWRMFPCGGFGVVDPWRRLKEIESSLRDFKAGRTPILVGTDVPLRPAHPERPPRHQLRPAARFGLRPPHRPHGPRRQHGPRHVLIWDKNRNIIRELIDLLSRTPGRVIVDGEHVCLFGRLRRRAPRRRRRRRRLRWARRAAGHVARQGNARTAAGLRRRRSRGARTTRPGDSSRPPVSRITPSRAASSRPHPPYGN